MTQQSIGGMSMSNPFSIRRSCEAGVSLIFLEGYLDAHTAPAFEEAIQKEVDADLFRIVVDCQKLDYISSAGLGVFMSFVEDVRDRQGDIKICGLTPNVKEVFDILGFPQIFEVLDSVQTAQLRFAGSGAGGPRGNI
jgi:anti-sigma B factor antagonist